MVLVGSVTRDGVTAIDAVRLRLFLINGDALVDLVGESRVGALEGDAMIGLGECVKAGEVSGSWLL
jgi:hypothetical protein